MPALRYGVDNYGTIIADSASGISGGGREPSRSYHYPECADNVTPYKVGTHRHTPEISRNLSRYVIFTPHLVPMNRGILSTIYIPLAGKYLIDEAEKNQTLPPRPKSVKVKKCLREIHALYRDFYKEEYFVRVLPLGSPASPNRVRGSNYCDIGVHIDQAGSVLIVTSAIDNMVKGASGQDIQNMNIIYGFEENTGLKMIPSGF
jgi:N-acetyl-gamma-glutamyl-phosphate reductase